MIVRFTHFSFSPEKIEELRKIYVEETTPVVRSQKGNLDCRLLEPVNTADDYVSMTVWDNQQDADAYHSGGTYKRLVERVRPFFTKEPVLKIYHTESVMEHA